MQRIKPPFRADHVGSLLRPAALKEAREKFAKDLLDAAGLRYGALPVVARVGGLADTVIDTNEAALAAGCGTGVQFAPLTREMLRTALQRTAVLWRQPTTWQRLQRNAMRSDVSWRRPAAQYAALYRTLLAERPSFSGSSE